MPAAVPPDLTLADRQQLAARNMRLAFHVAHRFRPRARRLGIDFEDVAAQALLYLTLAAARWDSARGSSFGAYAWPYVEGGCRRLLSSRRSRPLPGLPAGAGGKDADVPDPRAEEPGAGRDQDALFARRLLRHLLPRERAVIDLRYGLEDGVARPLAEAAAHLGLSKERVRQIEGRALERLRRAAGQDSGDGGDG